MNSSALEQFGSTQKRLLRYLLVHPRGSSVENLVCALSITPNAVRQHISGLERDGLIKKAGERPTGRRPQALYVLSDAGREVFPRHYSVMADQLIQETRSALGPEGLKAVMESMGSKVGKSLSPEELPTDEAEIAEFLADAMTKAGYEAFATPDQSEVVAYNCVFHHLASTFPEVCDYDLALIRNATGRDVSHTECMVRGGSACRFKLLDANDKSNH